MVRDCIVVHCATQLRMNNIDMIVSVAASKKCTGP